jgi:branched-chain amino acid transport system substrate-binding protein
VQLMLGPYGTSITLAVAPVTERYQVPLVEANGAASELFTKGYRYIFAVLSTADQYLTQALELAAKNADKLGKSKHELTIALATEDDQFGQDVRAGVLDDAMRLGINCVVDDQLPADLNDMTVTLSKVKALKPDVLLISGHEKGALTAIRQIDALNIDVPIIALTHCDAARLTEKEPELASHIFCPKQWHRSIKYRGKLFGSAEDFARRFEEVYGYEPPYQVAQSAAAVYVFANALERAQSLEPEKVRDAIAATDLATFYGPIKFD